MSVGRFNRGPIHAAAPAVSGSSAEERAWRAVHAAALAFKARHRLEAQPRTGVVGNKQEVRLHMSALRDAFHEPAATETVVIAPEAVVLQHDGEWSRMPILLCEESIE